MHTPSRILRAFIGACLLPGLAAFAQEAPAPPQRDMSAALAKVGDSIITGEEYARFARFRQRRLFVETGKQVEVDAKFRRDTLNELINARMLDVLARQANIQVTEEELKADFEESRKAFKDEAEYKQYMDAQQLSEDELMEEIRRKLLVTKFIDAKTDSIEVSDDEVKAEFEKRKEAGQMVRDERTVDMHQILFKFELNPPGPDGKPTAKPESIAPARAKAEAALERLKKGEDFEAVARELSEDPQSGPEGGLYEEVSRARVFPEIAKLLFSLPPGEISEIIESPLGCHIIRVKQINDPGDVPYERIESRLRMALLLDKKQQEVINIMKTARDSVHIEVFKATPEEAAQSTAPTTTDVPPSDLPAAQ